MPPKGFGEAAEKLRRSTVQILSGGPRAYGSGSGVIWSADGLVITNAHVARGPRARIELWDGRRFDGEVTGTDARRDLAALRIAAQNLPAVVPGDSSALRAGELVMAVGNPLGFIGALTTGVVHALGPLPGIGSQSWVQAAVRLAPGNSGGPLANAHGQVIGINTMVVSGGLALAIPSNLVAHFLRRGSTPQLGVTVRPVRLPHPPHVGLLLLEVDPRGAAAAASLLVGDILVGVNGQRLRSPDDLTAALDDSASGVLSLQFLRGDRNVQREVAVRFSYQGAAA